MWCKIKATPLIKKGVVVEWFNVPTWVNLKVGQSGFDIVVHSLKKVLIKIKHKVRQINSQK